MISRLSHEVLCLDTVMKPASNALCREVGNALIIVNVNDGNCYELNETGTLIWKTIATGGSPRSAVNMLLDKGKDFQTVASDVVRIVQSLLEVGLLQPHDEALSIGP